MIGSGHYLDQSDLSGRDDPNPLPPTHAHSSSTQLISTRIESGLSVVCLSSARSDVNDD